MPTKLGSGLVKEEADECIWEGREGRIVGMNEQGQPLVDFIGNTQGPRIARKTIPLESSTLRAFIDSGRRVELRFEDGHAQLPIIVSLGPPPPSSAPPATADPTSPVHVIKGGDELVFQCGKASITLRRNGKIIIKGTYVETQSEGVNRIKGGSIQLG
ncbi:hypothetical protein HUW62_14670 [Myxococcus sp. AM011]|uniref:DUF6484 domain-containing protein n=1 Tax=Myxococcus sp. AM011 TaxID=2745200 RepID=UPI0015957EEF|nr:DUF6484 domain-containing protein [Myxococcus sp. AM011]NVJ22462.1 hypothetical protein [Myxococcus sp. AM011]